jgi:transposase
VRQRRAAWREEFAAIDPARPVSLDESGADTAMARRYGRAPRGQRVVGAVPRGHWKVVTPTAAVRLGGAGACLAFDGATGAMAFETYVERCLAPTPRPGDIVVMDDLSAHKRAAVSATVGPAGAEVRYLPPYSPDFNPIEEMFSEVKEHLRQAATRSVDALYEAPGEALRAVTPGDIAGWFRHKGYFYRQS